MNSIAVLNFVIVTFLVVSCQKNDDEKRPYEFGFNIEGQQHRHEKKDATGIIEGEFGFITADGVYHVTVYATDENGNFRILSMRNVRVSAPLDGSPLPPGAKIESYPGYSAPQPQVPQAPQAPQPPQVPQSYPPPQQFERIVQPPVPAAPQQVTIRPIYTPQSTIGPSCGGCGVIEKLKQPFEFKTAFQNNKNLQPSSSPPDVELIGNQEQIPGAPIGTHQGIINPGPQIPNSLAPLAPGNQTPQGPGGLTPQGPGGLTPQGPGSLIPQGPVGLTPQGPGGLAPQGPGGLPPQGPGGLASPAPGGLNPYGLGGLAPQTPGGLSPQPPSFSNPEGSGNPTPVGPGGKGKTYQDYSNFITPRHDKENLVAGNAPSPSPPSRISQVTVSNNNIHIPGQPDLPIKDKIPGMRDGLPPGIEEKDITDLLYKFDYEVGFHGHYEKGTKSGAKIGGYFVNGRDGISRIVTYVADENGFRPKVKFVNLGLNSPKTPKEDTEKNFGLERFEFVWYPVD